MKLLTSEETQRLLRISRSTLYLWTRSGKLRPRRAGKALLFDEDEAMALLSQGNRVSACPATGPAIPDILARIRKGISGGPLMSWNREELHERGSD